MTPIGFGENGSGVGNKPRCEANLSRSRRPTKTTKVRHLTVRESKMILEGLVEKWSVRKARKREYKEGWRFLDGHVNPPWHITASMEEILDDLAPRKPHIGLGMVDAHLST